MRSKWKKEEMSSTEDLEAQLINAVDRRDKKRATSLLDRLHRTGVHEGCAIEAAKGLLFRRRKRRR